jgi:uncharacterized membrane protein
MDDPLTDSERLQIINGPWEAYWHLWYIYMCKGKGHWIYLCFLGVVLCLVGLPHVLNGSMYTCQRKLFFLLFARVCEEIPATSDSKSKVPTQTVLRTTYAAKCAET